MVNKLTIMYNTILKCYMKLLFLCIMTTSIGVEHVAPHVREWTCRRIVRCPPYADENTEQQNPYRVYQQCLSI